MQDAYPELKETAERAAKTVRAEEQRFAHTLDVGLGRLEEAIQSSRPAGSPAGDKVLSGDRAFKLYDTFGIPLDFMQDAARDQGLAFDQAGFERALAEQRERARASWKGAAKQTANPAYQQLPSSRFEGYRQTRSEGCGSSRHHSPRARRPGTPFRGGRRNHSRPHPLLCRIRRTGWRPGMAHERRSQYGRRRSEGVLLPDSRCARPSSNRQAPDPGGRSCRCRGQHRHPPGHHAQPHRHPPSACRAARGSGNACKAGGVARGPQSPAL